MYRKNHSKYRVQDYCGFRHPLGSWNVFPMDKRGSLCSESCGLQGVKGNPIDWLDKCAGLYYPALKGWRERAISGIAFQQNTAIPETAVAWPGGTRWVSPSHSFLRVVGVRLTKPSRSQRAGNARTTFFIAISLSGLRAEWRREGGGSGGTKQREFSTREHYGYPLQVREHQEAEGTILDW